MPPQSSQMILPSLYMLIPSNRPQIKNTQWSSCSMMIALPLALFHSFPHSRRCKSFLLQRLYMTLDCRHLPQNVLTRKSRLMTTYKQLKEVKHKQILIKVIKQKITHLLPNQKKIMVGMMISLRIPPQTLDHRMKALLIHLPTWNPKTT